MEIKVNKRIILKTIEEEIDSPLYITKDGTFFDVEEDALKHEKDLEFLSLFNEKYKLMNVEPNEYGLDIRNPIFCHFVYINKINEEVIEDFVNFYSLKDHPNDIQKLKEGWSFIALVSDVNLWIFDKTDRMFIVESLDFVIENKEKEIKKLLKLKEDEKF
jgi:hypothetical protein